MSIPQPRPPTASRAWLDVPFSERTMPRRTAPAGLPAASEIAACRPAIVTGSTGVRFGTASAGSTVSRVWSRSLPARPPRRASS